MNRRLPYNYKFRDNDNDVNIETYDNATKHHILDYLYRSIELSNYKYKLIEYEYDITLLKEKRYYVSPNYNGIHGLLIFIKLQDKYRSCIIDRKTLTYNQGQLDIDKVKFIPVTIRLDISIYNGTIIDGVLLYNNVDGVKNFVVNDLYLFRGQNLINDKITNKMINAASYIDNIKGDTSTDTMIIIPNKLYNMHEINQLINMYIPKSKYSKSIKGIAFYPEVSGTKLIYLYNNCSHEEDIIEEPVKPVRQPNIVVSETEITAVFKLKKTDIVDVYNIYLGEKAIQDGKKIFKYKKMGIAYIPTKECSYFCKDLFNKTEGDSVLVECKYDSGKNKWVPYKQVLDKKRPDLTDRLPEALNN